MSDWSAFRACVPWFLDKEAKVEEDTPRPGRALTDELAELLPTLSTLMASSSVTPVTIDEQPFELRAWDRRHGERFGWLEHTSPVTLPDNAFEQHAQLPQSFGGFVERFNEPEDAWTLNHGDVLTAKEAERDASFVSHYAWAWEDEGLTIPIDLDDWYPIAWEANGNTTLCHRETGDVLLFAPDHAFDHVTPLAGCPDHSLYTLEGAPTFSAWIETIADQWLREVAKA